MGRPRPGRTRDERQAARDRSIAESVSQVIEQRSLLRSDERRILEVGGPDVLAVVHMELELEAIGRDRSAKVVLLWRGVVGDDVIECADDSPLERHPRDRCPLVEQPKSLKPEVAMLVVNAEGRRSSSDASPKLAGLGSRRLVIRELCCWAVVHVRLTCVRKTEASFTRLSRAALAWHHPEQPLVDA